MAEYIIKICDIAPIEKGFDNNSVIVQELVRCKNCKYRKDCPARYEASQQYNDDWFCADGVKEK